MKNIKLKVNSIKRGSQDYLGDYLQTLGIAPQDIFSFTTMPRETDLDDPHNLTNMDRAVDTAYELLCKNTPTYIQPDPDTDGFTSSSILISYLKKRFPKLDISWKLHEGKDHGIEPAFIEDKYKLVFIPDAGSNDYSKQEQLVEKGHTVIILDHHEVENYRDTGAILVNNQSSVRFNNKYMSGAGIVYMFIKAMDEKYFSAPGTEPIADNYLDLTAVGIIADAMNMTSLGNNYIAYYGLQNIKNKFLKEIAIKQARGIKNPSWLSKIDVAFYIAPVINGLIRSGSQEEKTLIFRAMSTEECDEIFESEWRGNKRSETLWQYAARIAANAKSRQDAAKKKGFEMICQLIKDNGWDKHNLIIAPLDSKQSAKINANFTGLIAMELVKKFNKPCLVVRETDFNGKHLYGGSGRNGVFYKLPDLMSFIQSSGLLEYSAGHANAFGVFLPLENIAALREYSDKYLDSRIFSDNQIDVDYWFQESIESIDTEMLMQFGSVEKLYGNSIPQPKFAFTFNYQTGDYRVMGKSQDSVKISHDGVDFVAFNAAALIHDLGSHKEGTITLVGRSQINEWMGRKSVQIMIDDIEVTDKIEEAQPVEFEENPVDPTSLAWGDLL